MKKRTICTMHDAATAELMKLMKPNVHSSIRRRVHEAIMCIARAKSMGQRMEERLIDYRVAIQNLGYIRKKKNGGKKIQVTVTSE